MIRTALIAMLLLLAACITGRSAPLTTQYDFESVSDPVKSHIRLNATIAVLNVTAPSWVRTNALRYRLDYVTPANPQAYARSEWDAPPPELLTLRLRELIATANSGFTLSNLTSLTPGYRLDVVLQRFIQVFSSAHESHCVVAMSANLTGPGERVLSQRTFQADVPAPSADAPGAVYCLVHASDADLEQMLDWLGATLPATSHAPR
jgi:cholesterol transport system auxiliary component